MQLSSRLTKLFQSQTDKIFKYLFSENPDVIKSYVNGGLSAISMILAPVNVFMRHLLTVQGLDPDAVPGEAQRELLQTAFNSIFEATHEKDYDDDYDVSWARNRYKSVKEKLDITEDNYKSLTDLSRFNDDPPVLTKEKFDDLVQKVNPVALESEKRELPLVTTYFQDEIQALKSFVDSMEESKAKKNNLKPSSKKVNKGQRSGGIIRRITSNETPKEEPSTLEVKSDRKVRPSSKRPPRS
jgi:hypothetical protein